MAKGESIYEIMRRCSAVLAIQSTAVYEALHFNKAAIIYKRKTYHRHQHIFYLGNVFLIDNAEDLMLSLIHKENENVKQEISFFKEFNSQKFKTLNLQYVGNQ